MTASEERLDILLDRNASDIELDRPRHRLEGSARRGFGVATVEIDTATPQTGPTQPMRAQQPGHARRCGQHRTRRPMEPEIGRASCRERCVSTCRSRLSPYHSQNTPTKNHKQHNTPNTQ